ncbi:fibronectin type III-like domain-contianing protein [Streptomyces sp. NPDC058291]|uniref:fibronectin type III-like domain-contianing protein n=1 Tax=Streptomyces sp. NPDC058291 TaxID=3346427 RepID=UPI0036E7992E
MAARQRAGREVVQVCPAPTGTSAAPERPARRLAGSAVVEAGPGESAEVAVQIPARSFEVGDEADHRWSFVKGSYEIQVGRSIADRRITATINV